MKRLKTFDSSYFICKIQKQTPNHSITPNLYHYGTKTRIEFNESCFKQDSVTFNHKNVVNIYIVYDISKNFNISDYLTLENCLF